MRTATFKLCGQLSGSPSGCPSQSNSRIRRPISPPLARKLVGLAIPGADFTPRSLAFSRKPHNFGGEEEARGQGAKEPRSQGAKEPRNAERKGENEDEHAEGRTLNAVCANRRCLPALARERVEDGAHQILIRSGYRSAVGVSLKDKRPKILSYPLQGGRRPP
jgi:hypothetical protein